MYICIGNHRTSHGHHSRIPYFEQLHLFIPKCLKNSAEPFERTTNRSVVRNASRIWAPCARDRGKKSGTVSRITSVFQILHFHKLFLNRYFNSPKLYIYTFTFSFTLRLFIIQRERRFNRIAHNKRNLSKSNYSRDLDFFSIRERQIIHPSRDKCNTRKWRKVHGSLITQRRTARVGKLISIGTQQTRFRRKIAKSFNSLKQKIRYIIRSYDIFDIIHPSY